MGAVAVLGTTTWGVTFAWLLARNGHAVRIIARNTREARAINDDGRARRVPHIELPLRVVATSDVAAALSHVSALVIAVPSASIRENARRIGPQLPPELPVVHAVKGLELETAKRVSEMLLDEIPQLDEGNLCALSGPNLAGEIGRGLPAATVIAGRDESTVAAMQRLLHAPHFRVYASDDITGVELAGSLKNVIAIAAGIADGLQFGDNAKAGIITRGLAEVTRLGVAAGASASTFSGLAGVGDVIATCYSPLSRNRTFGEAIARGASVEEAIRNSAGVVEGVAATAAAVRLAERHSVDMPIARGLREILHGGAPPTAVIASLLEREPTREA